MASTPGPVSSAVRDNDTADAIAVGGDGTVFVAGNTESSIPGAGGTGVEDGFAKSFDANGGDRWTRTVGTRRVDGARDIAQGSGGVYVIGGTEGEIGPGVRARATTSTATYSSLGCRDNGEAAGYSRLRDRGRGSSPTALPSSLAFLRCSSSQVVRIRRSPTPRFD